MLGIEVKHLPLTPSYTTGSDVSMTISVVSEGPETETSGPRSGVFNRIHDPRPTLDFVVKSFTSGPWS